APRSRTHAGRRADSRNEAPRSGGRRALENQRVERPLKPLDSEGAKHAVVEVRKDPGLTLVPAAQADFGQALLGGHRTNALEADAALVEVRRNARKVRRPHHVREDTRVNHALEEVAIGALEERARSRTPRAGRGELPWAERLAGQEENAPGSYRARHRPHELFVAEDVVQQGGLADYVEASSRRSDELKRIGGDHVHATLRLGFGLSLQDLEHAARDVDPDNFRALVHELQGEVARPATEIEHPSGPRTYASEDPHDLVPPRPLLEPIVEVPLVEFVDVRVAIVVLFDPLVQLALIGRWVASLEGALLQRAHRR